MSVAKCSPISKIIQSEKIFKLLLSKSLRTSESPIDDCIVAVQPSARLPAVRPSPSRPHDSQIGQDRGFMFK